MRPSAEVHDALARLVSYPSPGFAEAAEEWVAQVAAGCPAAGAHLEEFLRWVRGCGDGEIEELFTRTFDVSQEAALEIGWHAYGENYTRGAFLVRMRQLLREQGVAESGELPDHLSHVLPVLARLEPAAAKLLAEEVVSPSVKRIAVALAAGAHPYEGVLDAVLAVLKLHYAQPEGCC
ncbi:MAG: molecular chaperone TorD family protein [Planctomycetes bacterium]|nr:molecular chaperone TorD family protein [Planctomycetota bacterium]